MGTDEETWRARRREAAAEHAAAFARRQAAETEQARRLIDEFVRAAAERGLRPEPLAARPGDGRARYRTGLTGWYLKRDRSVAVSADGDYYVMTVPASLRARVTGVRLTPTEPPLEVGKGGRDGESMPLADLLRQRLEAGPGW